MPTARISSRGQLVIPRSIRHHLGLEAGDRVDFVLRDDGEVVVRPALGEVTDLRGMLPKPPRPVTQAEMEAAIRARGGGGR